MDAVSVQRDSCPVGDPAAGVGDYSGKGTLAEAAFTTCQGETLSWTLSDTCNGMFINDNSQSEVLVDSAAASGSTYLAPGAHTIEVSACGDWTIHIG